MLVRTTVAALGLVLSTITVGQYAEKMDLTLRHYLAREQGVDPEISLFIHGDVDGIKDAVQRHGGRVTMTTDRLVNARVPSTMIRALAEEPAVHHFEFNIARGELMNDSARVKNHVIEVHAGLAPLPQGYDGAGVVVGVIDTGLDITHPDFKDANGVTRVYRYWDQVPPGSASSPQPYGYGTEYTREDLQAGGSIPVDPQGHGTTVAGTAAGNGLANGRHKGFAPASEIIMVASRLGAANWAGTVADGVKYILDHADALGMPAVINISMGSYSGSHDGKDAAALLIDDLLHQSNGRALTAAAGNSHGSFPYHVHTEVGPDTTFSWFQTNEFPLAYNVFDFPNVFFEVWADAVDVQNVQFAIGADRAQPTLNFRGRTAFHTVNEMIGSSVTEPLISASGNTLGTVQFYAQERGEQVLMQVLIASPDTADCLWRLMSTGSGSFDLWTLTTFTRTANVIGPMLAEQWPGGLPYPTPEEYPAMAHYVAPDHYQHIVDSWACIPDVLTVANYCNEVSYIDYFGVERTVDGTELDIAPFSSTGPTRDGRLKPDIAATGDVTFTPGPLEAIQWIIDNQVGYKVDPGGMHIRDGGTSQAAPVVAGVAALYLQKCPDAGIEEIANAIRKSARSDAFTGQVPNPRWGEGKVDAFGALLNRTRLQATTTTLCEGDAVEVTYIGDHGDLTWSTGATTTNPITVSTAADISATMITPSGCMAYTDTLHFTMAPVPATPQVELAGSVLTSSEALSYQWFEGGSPISGANEQEWTAYWVGSYQVQVTDANGCTALSEPVQVLTVGLDEISGGELRLWPSPVQEALNINMPASIASSELRIMGSDGRLVLAQRLTGGGTVQLPVGDLAAGTYTVVLLSEDVRWVQRFVRMP
ncbi:MAG TPA: S8 family serine peptidase, partial [Flavobacteriales bacterium]|nr:S8 family serine peptidase [Flavobacteriales bacterium]